LNKTLLPVDNWKLQIYSYGIYRIYIIFPLDPFLFSVFINDFDSYSEVYLIQTLRDKSVTCDRSMVFNNHSRCLYQTKL